MTREASMPAQPTSPPLLSGIPSAGTKAQDRTAERLLWMQLIGATFLQKIPITLGDTQLFLALPLMLGTALWGLMRGRLRLRSQTLLIYMLAFGGMTAVQIAHLDDAAFSITSLGLLGVVHLPYLMQLKRNSARRGFELAVFRKIMILMALLGIAQYGLQFAVGWQNAFFLDAQVPPFLFMQGFHQLNPLA